MALVFVSVLVIPYKLGANLCQKIKGISNVVRDAIDASFL